jgi:hypothetical protein
MPTNEEVRKFLYTEGEKQRRKVLGDAHVDKCKQWMPKETTAEE